MDDTQALDAASGQPAANASPGVARAQQYARIAAAGGDPVAVASTLLPLLREHAEACEREGRVQDAGGRHLRGSHRRLPREESAFSPSSRIYQNRCGVQGPNLGSGSSSN